MAWTFFIRRWLGRAFRRTPLDPPPARRRGYRPALEPLEERLPPAIDAGVLGSFGPALVGPVGPVGGQDGTADNSGGTGAITPPGGQTPGGPTTGGPTAGGGAGQPGNFTPVRIAGVSSDTGRSPTDALTRDNTLTVRGRATPGRVVSVYVDGHFNTTARVGRNGVWRAALGGRLSDGRHLLTAKTGKGNKDKATFQVTVDTRAPHLGLALPRATVARDPTLWVAISGDGTVAGGTLHIDIDRNGDGDFTDRGERDFMALDATPGTTSVTMRDLPEGIVRVQARVSDAAGNQAVTRTRVNVAIPFTADPSSFHSDPEAGRSLPSYDPGSGRVGGFGDNNGDGGGGGQVVADQNANEKEPNDSSGQANTVNPPNGSHLNISGSIGNSGDEDWFKFTLAKRSGVFFDIDAREIGLSNLDSDLTLYDSGGSSVIASNDNGFDFDTGLPAQNSQPSSNTGDSALYRELNAGTYFIRVTGANSTTGAYKLRILASDDFSNNVPQLSSLPGAKDTIYLDFTGHSANDDWGNYNVPAYDFNGNANELSPGEKLAIQNIWRVVSEDYSPFDINVTTVQPGSIADGQGMRAVINNDDGSALGLNSSTLGVALLDSYHDNDQQNQVCFQFAPNFDQSYGGGSSGQIMATTVEIGNTVSHECGHTFGLNHYNSQSGGFAGSADILPYAIMATPDLGLNREIWAAGKNEPGNQQDDVAVISSAHNTFGYRPDDAGDTTSQARALKAQGLTYRANGVIAQLTDRDVYSFQVAGSGPTTISVDVDDYLNDLNAKVRLLSKSGAALATADPNNSFDATVTRSLAPGTYFVEVSSNGKLKSEVGQYKLTVAVPGVPPGGGGGGGGGGGAGGRHRQFTFFNTKLEPNETSEWATEKGALSGSTTLDDLAIATAPTSGLPDYDWFHWAAGSAGTVTATLNVGRTAFSDDMLEIHLFTLDGITLKEIGSTRVGAHSSGQVTMTVDQDSDILVEVKGAELYMSEFGEGEYSLTVALS